jgi:WS/DGAT/MGAT family acyltransferase
MQAFDKERPPWELIQLDDLEHGQAALVMKLHHSISDGVGMVRMTSSLVERARDPDPRSEGRPPSLLEEPAGAGEPHGPFQEALAALRYEASAGLGRSARLVGGVARFASRALWAPRAAAGEAVGLAGSLARLLRPVREPLSPLLTARSLALRLDVVASTLVELQCAGRAAGGTVNDAFVAAVTGGLRRYHEHHGRPVDALRMTMPINLREGEAGRRAGNQFAPARFAVPIAIVDPIERMREIRRRVVAQRAERALPLTEEISAALAQLPRPLTVALFGSMLKAIDFITSNVPGPPFPVFASGARVVRMFGYGPLSGAAANVTAFSYDGRFEIGVAMDHAAVPDPERFVVCLREGLDEVLAAGRGGPAARAEPIR